MPGTAQDWQDRRREAIDAHARAADRARRQEAARAQQLLDDFVARAPATGLEPVPLRARDRYRTGLSGWYLRRDRTVAVDTEGRFYLLSATPVSWRSRFTGVRPEPSEPALLLGKGGRDGEPVDLADLIRQRLTEGPA
jgi:hypothetical protein